MNSINTAQISEGSISIENARATAIMHKGEVFTFFDQGLTRHVFANKEKTKVVKILINPNCIDHNREEMEVFENASIETRAQMVPTSIHGGVIEQEFVTPVKMSDKGLSIRQQLFASSCRNEVGWDKDGNLLCFDLDQFKKY